MLRISVALDSIEPSGANPREDMGDLDRLAESIEATGGEPINPPVVVMDGDTYRIVDGERRYRAMRKLYEDDPSHLVTVLAYDGYDEAMSAVAMVATDEKKNLTATELERGMQTILKLDIPEDKAAKALHTDAESVKRARRSRRKYGERAETQSMEDLLTLASDEWTDAERAQLEKAMDKPYNDVQHTARMIRAERRRKKHLQGLVDALGGRVEFDQAPAPKDWDRIGDMITSTKMLNEVLAEHKDILDTLVAHPAPYDSSSMQLYQKPIPGQPSKSEREQADRDYYDQISTAYYEAVAWWVELALGGNATKEFVRAVAPSLDRSTSWLSNLPFIDDATGESVCACEPSLYECACYLATPSSRPFRLEWQNGIYGLSWRGDMCERFCALYDLMRTKAGWVPSDEVSAAYTAIAAHRGNADG